MRVKNHLFYQIYPMINNIHGDKILKKKNLLMIIILTLILN